MTFRLPLPPLLSAWCAVETAYYGAPAGGSMDAIQTSPDTKILFNGHESWSALVRCLLAHDIPLISVVKKNPADHLWYIVAQSYPAIPDPCVFIRSVTVCLLRIKSLLERCENTSFDTVQGPVFSPESDPIIIAGKDIFIFIGRAIGRKVINLLKSPFFRADHWQLAFCRKHPHADNWAGQDWRLLLPDEVMLQADPFLLVDSAGVIHIFYEYMPYSTQKGVINHMSFDPDSGAFSSPKTVLECPVHLSFPFLFSYQNDIYMIPETGTSRTLEVYKATRFPDTWQLDKTLMTDIIANDTVLHHDGTLWWMFTSIGTKGQKNWDEVSLFYADHPFGPWLPHPMNPIVSDCRSARMAGNIFRDHAGRLIRPAQNCTHGYGVGVTLCEIKVLTPTTYQERVVDAIDAPRGYTGTHTLNMTGDFCIFDVKSLHRK